MIERTLEYSFKMCNVQSNPIYSPRRSEIYNEPEPEAVPEDPDTVSKNEWMALAETGELQVGHVRNILASFFFVDYYSYFF